MERTVEAIAKHVHGRLIGDGATLIHGVNTLEAVRAGELSFADTPQRLAQALGEVIVEGEGRAPVIDADVRRRSTEYRDRMRSG